MNFQFSNLLGAPYRGGNLVIHNNELLTPVGNRVGQVRAWASIDRMGPRSRERSTAAKHTAPPLEFASTPPPTASRTRMLRSTSCNRPARLFPSRT
jgi:hypothetical protein